MFATHNDLQGRLESRISRASATKEFLKANFDGRDLRDTVYVTASPILYRNRDRVDVDFHHVYNIWKEDGWDDQYRTVLPETVTEYAKEANERFPDKRLLIHFLQPHYPFIGPTGRKHFDLDQLNFRWRDVMTGSLEIDDGILWSAFVENLELVLPHVEELLNCLEGKTVVTADHGQMMGERSWPLPHREYGHPPGIYTKQLVKVPWFIGEYETRRDVVSEVATDENREGSVDDDVVEDRLKQLGYFE
jgi:hypothetical protein